jgi:phage terminase large subunit-like protein
MVKRTEATTADAVEYALEFTLSKPIQAYGEDVSVLKMRKPTGKDLIQVGNPVTFYPHVEPVKIEHDMGRVVQMAARMANVPSSSIERMDPDELTALAWAISPFFIPAR